MCKTTFIVLNKESEVHDHGGAGIYLDENSNDEHFNQIKIVEKNQNSTNHVHEECERHEDCYAESELLSRVGGCLEAENHLRILFYIFLQFFYNFFYNFWKPKIT